MLSLLAVCTLRQPGRSDPPFPRDTLAHARQALAKIGYRFAPEADDPSSGTLTHAGVTVTAIITGEEAGSGGRLPNGVTGVGFDLTLDISAEVPLEPGAIFQAPDWAARTPHFVSHLGRTVDVDTSIEFGKRPTLASVRAELDRNWRAIGAYAKAHGALFADAKPRDWQRYRFSDALKLAVADEESLTRLAKSWGWWTTDGHEGNPEPWSFPIRVHGLKLGVLQDFGYGLPPGRSFRVGASLFPPKGFDTKRWVETQGKRLRWAELQSDVDGVVQASLIFDLSHGPTVGSLRRRTVNFAAHVAKLREGLHAAM